MWDRRRYPPNWEETALAIKERAGWCCEWCGVAYGAWRISRKGKPYKVVMTVAHLGVPYPDRRLGNRDDKWDVRPENLACLCQACHRRYDNRKGRRKRSKQARQPHTHEAGPAAAQRELALASG